MIFEARMGDLGVKMFGGTGGIFNINPSGTIGRRCQVITNYNFLIPKSLQPDVVDL